jgi:hypothetical protein
MSGIYDAVQNPIPRSGLYATPVNLAELTKVIEALSPQEKALVYPYVMMALNTCNKLVEDNILSKEIFV